MRTEIRYTLPAAGLIAALAFTACSKNDPNRSATDSDGAQSQTLGDSAKMIARNLKTFDTLDFDVFSNQKWDRLKESHAQDIIVSWPDGHDTHGLDKHIEDLKAMFVAIPDLKIPEHPIKIANGHWTAVTGRLVGTFSKPMPIGNGCRRNGSRVAVLGQPDVHEAARPRSLNHSQQRASKKWRAAVVKGTVYYATPPAILLA